MPGTNRVVVIARFSVVLYVLIWLFFLPLWAWISYRTVYHNDLLGTFKDGMNDYWPPYLLWLIFAGEVLFVAVGLFIQRPFFHSILFHECRAIWIENENLQICTMGLAGTTVDTIAKRDIISVQAANFPLSIFPKRYILIYVKNRSYPVWLLALFLLEPRDVVVERLNAAIIPAAFAPVAAASPVTAAK